MLKPDHPFVAAFDPMAFFGRPTLGHGIVRDLTGRVVRRCIIETRAENATEYGALHFDETYLFDDGSPPDEMHWVVRREGPESFDAKEISVFGPLHSKLRGPEWKLRFHRQPAPPSRDPRMLYDVTFNQIVPELVTKQVNLRLLGVTIARMWAFHRHI